MPSRRTTDAAQIAPYLTHAVSHHGQVTLVPADNNGRVRQATGKGSRGRQRQERNARTDEEVRFNVGPRSLRNLVGNRAGRRGGRQDRGELYGADAYPDYPPPSFLEATSVPTSPGTLDSQPASPIIQATHVSARTPSSSCEPLASPAGDDADSETSSLEIIDMDSVPVEEQLPSGPQLEENIRRDWINRRGVEFPSPPESQTRGRSKSRSRGILDLDMEDASEEFHYEPRQTSPKNKNSSLSPLRTLFPYRLMAVDQPFSASPHSSPYSSRSSLPFLSATSLKMSMSTTSISSIKGEGFFSRKLLSFKGKERARESLDAWEVVEANTDVGLPSDNPSPTRSQSFTYGMPVSPIHTAKEQTTPAATTTTSTTPHPLSLRDRKPPPVPFVTRPRPKKQAPPPPPKPAALAAVPQGPILTSVRTRKPPPPPKKPAHLTSSPLGLDSWRRSSLDIDTESSILQRAIVTPLPLSPIDSRSDDATFIPTSPTASSPAVSIAVSVYEPTPTSTIDRPMPSWESPSFARATDSDLPPMPGNYPDDNEPQQSQPPISVRSPTPDDDTFSTPRRHYPGRPLPQPPGATRTFLDSIDGDHRESRPDLNQTSELHCPEGLLIDLDDSFDSRPSTPFNPNEGSSLATPSYATSSSSSVDLLGSIADMPSPVIAQSPRLGIEERAPIFPTQAASAIAPFSEITDLDVLVSQISDEQRQDGSNYEALLLLSEFIGPASPPRNAGSISSTTARQDETILAPTTEELHQARNVPLHGSVQVERRRTTKDGRVKLKLGLLGVAVDKCGICLTQFRSGDAGNLGSACRHAFHDRCLGRWLARSKTCPMCRVPFTEEKAPL